MRKRYHNHFARKFHRLLVRLILFYWRSPVEQMVQEFEALHGSDGALCVREFHVPDADGGGSIVATIYTPTMERLGPVCRYTIEGAGISIDEVMGGPDRLAAILNTFYALRERLEEFSRELTWIGPPGHLDLPKRMPYFGFHFMRHCEEMIDAQAKHAAENLSETKRLWGEEPGKRYEDCEGYKLTQEDKP